MLQTIEKREVRVESKVAALSLSIDDSRWVTVVYDAYENPPKLTLVIHNEILTQEVVDVVRDGDLVGVPEVVVIDTGADD